MVESQDGSRFEAQLVSLRAENSRGFPGGAGAPSRRVVSYAAAGLGSPGQNAHHSDAVFLRPPFA